MDIISELAEKGWFLSNKGLEICKEGLNRVDVSGIIQKSLNIDFREIGGKFFPDELNRGKLDSISGNGVVQIQRIKNATAPKYEYGSGAPPILRLLLTDGNSYVNCLQWGQWKSINMDTPPGTKIFLKPGKISMQNNFLLLSENQFNFLGGHVAPMVEKWELNRQLESHVRAKGNLDGNGPPPWIPFGKPINAAKQPLKGKNFRSLETENKEVKEEDEAFKQQILANIAEVARVKEGKPKVFGGGKDLKPSNAKQEYNSFSHTIPGNSSDTANHTKSYRNFNEPDNRQPHSNQNEYKQNKYNRNGRNWSNQDTARAPSTQENFTQGQSYVKDKRMDQRNKFQNDFKTPRNQNPHHQNDFQAPRNQNAYHQGDYQNPRNQNAYHQGDYQNPRNQNAHHQNDFQNPRNQNAHHQNDFQNPRNQNAYHQNDFQNPKNQNAHHQNNFQNPRYENTHYASDFPNLRTQNVQQQRTFNNSTASKKFSKNSNFQENTKTTERSHSNDQSNVVDDLSQRISNVKLHGYDNSGQGTITIPNKPFIKVGAEVLAKYWEDSEFYSAKITAIGPEGKTCVVWFQDYGNHEEVLVNDIQQIQSGWNAGPISFQPSHWNGREKDQDYRQNSDYQENRQRSGQGQRRHDNQRQQRHDFRPSTKLYQPPQQRHTP